MKKKNLNIYLPSANAHKCDKYEKMNHLRPLLLLQPSYEYDEDLLRILIYLVVVAPLVFFLGNAEIKNIFA